MTQVPQTEPEMPKAYEAATVESRLFKFWLDNDYFRAEVDPEKKPFTVTAAYSKGFDWADIQSERPMTFLIDREGVIVDYFTGGYDFEFFESKIRDHLE